MVEGLTVRIRLIPAPGKAGRHNGPVGRPVLLAGAAGRPSKIARVRANQPSAPPAKVGAALGRLVPSLNGSIQALVLPLAAGRVVATDARSGRSYLAELQRFAEDAPVGNPLADPALFFEEWLHWWSEWAARGHLKDPVLAVTLRALQVVGRTQGWRDRDFRVTGRELNP
jgi:hypothetical protein